MSDDEDLRILSFTDRTMTDVTVSKQRKREHPRRVSITCSSTPEQSNVENAEGSTKKQKTGHWSQGLLVSLNDPSLMVFDDDLVTAIKDIYPKAKHHYLVCPKERIPTLKHLKPTHVSLLKHMSDVGERLAERHKGRTFRMGYHAIPSMVQLHLHVISDDFDSPTLKTKKHWNSFNTKYFVSSDDLIKQLKSGGIQHMSKVEADELLKTSLKCHKCDYVPKGMPDLKSHILVHLK